jgi:hypothetical protein
MGSFIGRICREAAGPDGHQLSREWLWLTEAVVKGVRQAKLHDLTNTIPRLRLDRSNCWNWIEFNAAKY